jgi:type III secretory pathway component EscS
VPRPAPNWDPVATVGLLLIGLLDVTRTVTVGRDFGAFLDAVFVQAGIGDYTDEPVAQVVGWVVILVNVLGLVVAIALAVPRLRTRRIAFWIPLAVGVVCLVLTLGLSLGAAIADPAFAAKLSAR